jgi:hypothetical protein
MFGSVGCSAQARRSCDRACGLVDFDMRPPLRRRNEIRARKAERGNAGLRNPVKTGTKMAEDSRRKGA